MTEDGKDISPAFKEYIFFNRKSRFFSDIFYLFERKSM